MSSMMLSWGSQLTATSTAAAAEEKSVTTAYVAQKSATPHTARDDAEAAAAAAMTSPTTATAADVEESETMTVVFKLPATARHAVSAHTSPPPPASLKQHQRLLARRHLSQSRRLHPRMSPLEAKVVLRGFAARLSDVSLEERLLADEAVFWMESVASLQHQ